MNNSTDIPSPSESTDQDNAWFEFVNEIQNGKHFSFEEQLEAYHRIFSNRIVEDGPPKVWIPGDYEKTFSNIAGLMAAKGFDNYKDLHNWSVEKRDEFWETVIELIGFNFSRNPEQIIDLSPGKDNPIWLPGAELNCVDSCFHAEADKVAIVYGKENSSELTKMTYGEL